MAKYDAGTKVRVVDYEDAQDPMSIVGEEGVVSERNVDGDRYTRVDFDLPDHRNGEWLFLDDEIEAVE